MLTLVDRMLERPIWRRLLYLFLFLNLIFLGLMALLFGFMGLVGFLFTGRLVGHSAGIFGYFYLFFFTLVSPAVTALTIFYFIHRNKKFIPIIFFASLPVYLFYVFAQMNRLTQ